MDVAEEVRLVVSSSLQIPIAQLTEGIRLEDLGAESLKIIEMVFDLEEKFDIFIKLDGAGLAAGTTKGRVRDHRRCLPGCYDLSTPRSR